MGSLWSHKEISYVRDNYQTLGNKEMSLHLCRSAAAIKRKLYQLGIKRTHNELVIIRSRIMKIPQAGHFKKGCLPHNTKYDGHERVTKDGYIEIRIAKGDYRLKHLYLWEQLNGPLPKGSCLKCLDSNKHNTSPDNWKLITRIENMLRNSKYSPPEVLIPVMVVARQLDNVIKNRSNGKQ